jgi:hypothetical protein
LTLCLIFFPRRWQAQTPTLFVCLRLCVCIALGKEATGKKKSAEIYTKRKEGSKTNGTRLNEAKIGCAHASFARLGAFERCNWNTS